MAVDFTASAARARGRLSARDMSVRTAKAVKGWRATREANLKQSGIVIPISEWLGHNNGPPMLESQTLLERQWRMARAAALAPPDPATGRRWADLAQRLGLSYEEYRIELLERGRHPTQEDAARIRAGRPLVRLTDV